MTSWTTILRDLALTAIRAVSRATTSGRSGGSSGIDIPDLATVDEARRGQRERAAQTHDRTPDHPAAESDEPVAAPAPATTPDAPARRSRAEAAPADDAPPRPFRPRDDDGDDAHVDAQGDAGGGISPSDADPDRDRRRMDRDDDGVASAGQVGPAATIEVDPRDLDLVRTSYNPDTDGDPDPGEIVWTWVPYEEADGRGKDRPVVVVARLPDAAVLAVQLSSHDHDGDRGWVGIGAGDWDGEHRPSWVNLDRILRIHPDGMRREAAILDRDRFARLSAALASHHHWPS